MQFQDLLKQMISLMIFLNMASVAQAQNSCSDVFASSNFDRIEVRNLGNPEAQKALQDLGNEMNDWLLPSMRVTNLIVNPSPETPLFGSYLLEAARDNPVRPDQYQDSQNIRFMKLGVKDIGDHQQLAIKAVFAHELGHAILGQHFKLSVGEKRISSNDFFVRWKNTKSDPSFIEMQSRLDKVDAEWEDTFNSKSFLSPFEPNYAELREAARAATLKKRKEISVRLNEIHALMREKIYSEHIIGQGEVKDAVARILIHNEFFADLTSALYFDSKTIMADALQYPQNGPWNDGRSTNLNGPRPRDFSNLTNFRHWEYDRELQGAYINLDPTRAALFKLIEKHKIQKSKYPLVLKSVLEAIENHSALMTGRSYEENKNATKMNQEFIRFVVISLRENGLLR
jgi:hypothetical protein